MAKALGEYAPYPRRSLLANTVAGTIKVTIGASGAVVAATSDIPPGFAVAKNTTGVYDVTFPPCAKMYFSASVMFSNSPTVGPAFGSAAVDTTNGTWQFKTIANAIATPVEPASGDVIAIQYEGQFALVQ